MWCRSVRRPGGVGPALSLGLRVQPAEGLGLGDAGDGDHEGMGVRDDDAAAAGQEVGDDGDPAIAQEGVRRWGGPRPAVDRADCKKS